MNKTLDMDGNELKIGDTVLFGTGDKRIARAIITDITDYGWLKLHTLKNRKSSMSAESVLLDMTKENKKGGI